MRLEAQILEEKNRNETLESYTSTISHEFRTPLSTSLMFLEQILSNAEEEKCLRFYHVANYWESEFFKKKKLEGPELEP